MWVLRRSYNEDEGEREMFDLRDDCADDRRVVRGYHLTAHWRGRDPMDEAGASSTKERGK